MLGPTCKYKGDTCEISQALWALIRSDRSDERIKYIAVKFAVFCANELALPVFKDVEPGDYRPRKAVEAAERWLSDGTRPTKNVRDDAVMAAQCAKTDLPAWSAVSALIAATSWSADAAVSATVSTLLTAIAAQPTDDRNAAKDRCQDYLNTLL